MSLVHWTSSAQSQWWSTCFIPYHVFISDSLSEQTPNIYWQSTDVTFLEGLLYTILYLCYNGPTFITVSDLLIVYHVIFLLVTYLLYIIPCFCYWLQWPTYFTPYYNCISVSQPFLTARHLLHTVCHPAIQVRKTILLCKSTPTQSACLLTIYHLHKDNSQNTSLKRDQ